MNSGLIQREIDGQIYEFEKWGAEKSLDVLLDLAKVCGKPLGLAVGHFFESDADGNKGLNKKFDPNILGMIFDSLTGGLDKELCKSIIKKLCSESCLCDGKKVNFNLHYQERLAHMFKVVKAALDVQYGNFISAVLEATGQSVPQGIANQPK